MAGVFTNDGSAHGLTGGFSVFAYDVTGSAGTLFLYGIVIGAAAVLGLSLLVIGARRASLTRTRRGPTQSRHNRTLADQERDDLIQQPDTARAETAEAQRDDDPAVTGERRRGPHWFGHHSAPR